jgi:hypothetical protein
MKEVNAVPDRHATKGTIGPLCLARHKANVHLASLDKGACCSGMDELAGGQLPPDGASQVGGVRFTQPDSQSSSSTHVC